MDQNEFYEPTENDKELTAFVVDHCDRWRDYRNVNFLDDYLEYERIFRGEWAAEDKTRYTSGFYVFRISSFTTERQDIQSNKHLIFYSLCDSFISTTLFV